MISAGNTAWVITLGLSPELLCIFWCLNCGNTSSQSQLSSPTCVCELPVLLGDICQGWGSCDTLLQHADLSVILRALQGHRVEAAPPSLSPALLPTWGPALLLPWERWDSWRTEPHATCRNEVAKGRAPYAHFSLAACCSHSCLWKHWWKQLILRWYNSFNYFFPPQSLDLLNKFVYPSCSTLGLSTHSQATQNRGWAQLELPARMLLMNCLQTSFRPAITHRNYSANSFE